MRRGRCEHSERRKKETWGEKDNKQTWSLVVISTCSCNGCFSDQRNDITHEWELRSNTIVHDAMIKASGREVPSEMKARTRTCDVEYVNIMKDENKIGKRKMRLHTITCEISMLLQWAPPPLAQ